MVARTPAQNLTPGVPPMARRLRPVGLDFIDDAPVRLVFAGDTVAPPEAVYQALAEEVEGWADWFGAVTLARPTHGARAARSG